MTLWIVLCGEVIKITPQVEHFHRQLDSRNSSNLAAEVIPPRARPISMRFSIRVLRLRKRRARRLSSSVMAA